MYTLGEGPVRDPPMRVAPQASPRYPQQPPFPARSPRAAVAAWNPGQPMAPSGPPPQFPGVVPGQQPYSSYQYGGQVPPSVVIASQLSPRAVRQMLMGEDYEEEGPPPSCMAVVCNFQEWIPAILLFSTEIVLGIWLYFSGNKPLFMIFSMVTWLVGLVLHEFSHALVAYLSGDYTVLYKGYLTMNITRYTSAISSLLIPLIFLLLGGIGLPGGAVFIERDRIRTKWQDSLVSLAGPLASFACGLLCAIPFKFVEPADYADASDKRWFWYAFAFCVFFFFVATVLNSFPVPPFDGYGAIRPWLPERLVNTIESPQIYPTLSFISVLAVFLMFWRIPGAIRFLLSMTEGVGVPQFVLIRAIRNFRLVK